MLGKKVKITLKFVLYFNLDHRHIKNDKKEMNQNFREFILIDRILSCGYFSLFNVIYFSNSPVWTSTTFYFKRKLKKRKRNPSMHFPADLAPPHLYFRHQ